MIVSGEVILYLNPMMAKPIFLYTMANKFVIDEEPRNVTNSTSKGLQRLILVKPMMSGLGRRSMLAIVYKVISRKESREKSQSAYRGWI